jgi:hypothetical protein
MLVQSVDEAVRKSLEEILASFRSCKGEFGHPEEE